MKYTVKITTNHTTGYYDSFEIEAIDIAEAQAIATQEAYDRGYDVEDISIELSEQPDEVETIKLSEMSVGDKAEYQGDIIKLKDNGKQGGTEHDLYLAYICDARESTEKYPTLIVDRDDVSI